MSDPTLSPVRRAILSRIAELGRPVLPHEVLDGRANYLRQMAVNGLVRWQGAIWTAAGTAERESPPLILKRSAGYVITAFGRKALGI